MQRLVILLGAFLLAWMGLRILPAEGEVAGWMVRDVALVALPAIALAAWQALPLPVRDGGERAWPRSGRLLFAIGLLIALSAGALQALALPGAPILVWIPGIWWVGLLLTLGGAWWPGKVTRYATPSYRWERDSRGSFVKRATPGSPTHDAIEWSRGLKLLLLAIIVAGGVLRLGLALQGPTACLPAECALLADAGTPRASLLVDPLTNALAWLGVEPLTALRGAQAIVATLLLPALGAAIAGLATPAGLLLGTAAAAFSLWPLLTGAGGSPALEPSLLILLVVAGANHAVVRRHASRTAPTRGWAVAGLALGALAVVAPSFALGWLIWGLTLLGIQLWPLRREAIGGAGVLFGAFLAGGALAGTALSTALVPLQGAPPFAEQLAFAGLVLQALVDGLGVLLVTGGVVGMGALLRGRSRAVVVLVGALVTWVMVGRVGTAALGTATGALDAAAGVLTPWLLLAAAVAADQLVRATLRAWRPGGEVTFRPASLVAALVALIVVVQGIPVARSWQGGSVQVANSSDREAMAAVEYLNTLRNSDADSEVLVLVAETLFAHPALRVAAADELAAGLLLPFDAAAVPMGTDAPGGLVALLPPTAVAELDWLRAAYPTGMSTPLAAGGTAPVSPLSEGVPETFAEGVAASLPTLVAFRVDAEGMAASRGLMQRLYADGDLGSLELAYTQSGTGPLDFAWEQNSPLPTPFHATWSGSLLVPATGVYTFTAEIAPDALISLQLDKRLILDSSAGLLERGERLAAGAYSLDLRYRSGDAPSDVALRWQPPGQSELLAIPLEVLHSPPMPLQGLLATTTAGDSWEGPALAQRKDPVVRPLSAPDGAGDGPWGTIWQGQLAVPRSGEYLIGAVADDTIVVSVAGRTVVERIGAPSLDAPAVTEGAVYLEKGWQPFSVRMLHRGSRAPAFSLYWQPPGAGAGPLQPTSFVPLIGALSDADLALPPAFPADANLGDEQFALSRDPTIWQPSRRLPPQNLPPLPFERIWSVGACGNDLGQFSEPRGIAVDPQAGLLYIADTANRRIVTLSFAGDDFQVLPIEALEEPVDVALTPDGTLLVLDTVMPRLVRYNPETGATSEQPLPAGFYRPRGLDVDPRGLILIADTGGGRVAVLDANGDVQASLGGPDSALAAGQPVDVVATEGAPWAIAAEHGRLWRLDTMGSLTAIQPTNTINGPHLARAGNRLFLSDPGGRTVLYIDETGRPLGALSDAGAFLRPTGVAVWRAEPSEVAPAGATTLFVADSEACSISAWLGTVE